MIFLTVGTHEPFDRLVRAVDTWCAHRPDMVVFGQITDRGAAGYQPMNFEWVARMTPERYEAMVRESRFLISHAGMGSMIAAMTLSKPIVVLPRRHHLREQRNDHQYATAQRWESHPGVFVAFDERELPELLDHVANRTGGDQTIPLATFAGDEITIVVRDLIHSRARMRANGPTVGGHVPPLNDA